MWQGAKLKIAHSLLGYTMGMILEAQMANHKEAETHRNTFEQTWFPLELAKKTVLFFPICFLDEI